MKNASANANELSETLTVEYISRVKAAITNQIIEVAQVRNLRDKKQKTAPADGFLWCVRHHVSLPA